jgi:transcriptional regulator with XRE-family HTH domain
VFFHRGQGWGAMAPGHDDDVSLGARVRAFREARRLSVRRLAAMAGLSPSLVSQFERGQSNVSIGALRRIAQALGLATADLFDTGEITQHRFVRREDRPVLRAGPGTRKYLISPRPAKHAEVYTAEIGPGGTTSEEPYTHGCSQEILLVLRGRIRCWVGEDSFEMSEGDSVEYQTDIPHRAANSGTDTAEILWVISPPSAH